MTAPDFSRYTEAQLRQALSRIDTAQYPERVQEIEARLADPASLPGASPGSTNAPVAPYLPRAMTIAGPLRRLCAFVIDMLLLGAVGWTAGLVLRDQFAALGSWGLLIGFGATLAYFGVMESRAGGGQSLGKRLLGLRVVDRTGRLLGQAPALRRTALFCAAYFLHAAPLVFGETNRWAAVTQSAVVFALSLGLPYLVAFNRPSRQSIHDLAAGALVVHAGAGPLAQPVQPLWGGHVAIIGAASALLFAGSAYLVYRAPQMDAASFERTSRAVARVAGLGRPTLFIGTMRMAGNSTNLLTIQVPVANSVPPSPALALQVVQAVFDTVPVAARQHEINIVLRSGYDIGIANASTVTNFSGTPDEWRARLDAANSQAQHD